MEIGINVMSSIEAMRQDYVNSLKRLKEAGCSYLEAMSDWGAKKNDMYYVLDQDRSSGDILEDHAKSICFIKALMSRRSF